MQKLEIEKMKKLEIAKKSLDRSAKSAFVQMKEGDLDLRLKRLRSPIAVAVEPTAISCTRSIAPLSQDAPHASASPKDLEDQEDQFPEASVCEASGNAALARESVRCTCVGRQLPTVYCLSSEVARRTPPYGGYIAAHGCTC
jgi:hypothetical protein